MQINEAVSSLKTLIGGLDELKSSLNNTFGATKNNNLKENIEGTSKALKTMTTIKKALNFAGIAYGLKKGLSFVKDIVSANIDMIETNNLFEVSMGKVVDQYGNLDEEASRYYTKSIEFQDKLNEKFLTNMSRMKGVQSQFYNLYKTQGVKKESAYFISEQLTKAAIDMASFHNKDIDTMSKALVSGITGQVESLRNVAQVDISESSLTSVIRNAGITDRSVQQLSYAEKEVARYIAIVEQAKVAQGDFARTFDSPANQIKIFKNQLAELQQVAGAFITNVFGNILVYVNAIIMVVKEILKSFANLFGYDLNTGGANLSATTGVDDLNSGLGSASKKAKELKKQLMGFDEINNIDPASKTGGSGGSGVATGIDDKLLKSLKEWDNMMDSINGKAQKIRDQILDWLGVTDGSYNNLKKIWEIAKAIGIAFATWKISSTIFDLLNKLNIFKGNSFQMAFGMTLALTGIYLLYKGTKRLLDGDIDLFSILETIGGGAMSTFGIANMLRSINNGKTFSWGRSLEIGLGITLAIQGFQVLTDGINTGDVKKTILGALELTGSLGLTLNGIFGGKLLSGIKNTILGVKNLGSAVNLTTGAVGKHSLAVAGAGTSMGSFAKTAGTMVLGLAGITGGSVLTYKGMKDLTAGTTNATKAIAEVTGGLTLATASGVLAGSQFGTIGMIIGGVAGFTTSAITAFVGYKEGLESLNIPTTTLTDEIKSLTEELDNNRKKHEEAVKSIKDTSENQLVEAEYANKLSQQLNGLVDVNGKVKAGNEERVNFILGELNNALGTEYKLNGNIITKNGEVVESYKKLQEDIKKTIEAKKKEAEQTAITELYKESIKEQIRLERDKMKAKETYAKAEKEYNDLMAKGLSNWTLTHDEGCKKIIQNYIDTSDKLNETRDKYWEATNDVSYYSQQMTDNIVKNTGKLSKEMVTQGQVSSDKLKEMTTNNVENWENTYNQLNTVQQSAMLAQSTSLDKWSPIIEQKWKDMANKSSKDFLNGIATVDEKTQAKILSTVTTTENMTPDMAIAWSNLGNKSFAEFAVALSKVEPDLQDKIITSITTTQGLTPIMQQAWVAMASTSKDRFNKALSTLPEDTRILIETITNTTENLSPEQIQKWADLAKNNKSAYDKNLTGLDETTRQRVQSCVDAVNNKQWSAEEASKGLARAVERGVNTIDTTEAGKQAVNGVAEGIDKNKNNWSLWSSLKGLKDTIVGGVKSLLGIHSPSKVMADLAQYIPMGIAKGIKGNAYQAIKSAKDMVLGVNDMVSSNIDIDTFKELNNGIKINTKDFSVDANQYVDYGAIKGQVQTQSNVTVSSNIVTDIVQAIKEGISESEVNVNIEAKTEEGTIVRKASQGFKDYVMQTGELPFPVPV